MTRTCALCKHPERQHLEASIINGSLNMREVAEYIHRSNASVSRHMNNHVTSTVKTARYQQLKEDQELSFKSAMQELWENEAASGFNVIAEMEELRTRTQSIISEASDAGDYRIALKAIEVAQKQLEFRAKMEGLLTEKRENLAELSKILKILYETLDLSPEQKSTVVQALLEGEDGPLS